MPGRQGARHQPCSRYICALAETSQRTENHLKPPSMKQLFRIAGIALFASLVFAQSALCQRSYAIAFGGGVAFPVGKLNDVQTTGYNGLVALAVGSAELPLGLRIDGIYNTFQSRTAPAGGPSSSDLRIMGALSNLVIAFRGTSAKPYLLVGGGLYNIKSDTSGAKSDNHFGFNAGVGATFGVGPFATFVESRYHTISRKADKGGVAQFIPITVGLMF